jgi:hypothetical protein
LISPIFFGPLRDEVARLWLLLSLRICHTTSFANSVACDTLSTLFAQTREAEERSRLPTKQRNHRKTSFVSMMVSLTLLTFFVQLQDEAAHSCHQWNPWVRRTIIFVNMAA